MRKFIASLLASYWAFIQKHPVISIFTSVIMIAACAGGIYLILVQFPTFISLPCFTGGCD
jgi:hypothetical protein